MEGTRLAEARRVQDEVFRWALQYNLNYLVTFHNVVQALLRKERDAPETPSEPGVKTTLEFYDRLNTANMVLLALGYLDEMMTLFWRQRFPDTPTPSGTSIRRSERRDAGRFVPPVARGTCLNRSLRTPTPATRSVPGDDIVFMAGKASQASSAGRSTSPPSTSRRSSSARTGLQVVRPQAGVLGNAGEHLGANLRVVVKGGRRRRSSPVERAFGGNPSGA